MEGYLRIKINTKNIFKSYITFEKAFIIINYLEAKIYLKIGKKDNKWK